MTNLSAPTPTVLAASDRSPSSTASLHHAAAPTTHGVPATKKRCGRVLLASHLTALESVGGGEIQMLELAQELPSAGVDGRLWRPWEDRFQSGDVLHLFGSAPAHLPVIAAARRQGVAIALSPITWFSWCTTWAAEPSFVRRTMAVAKYALRRTVPALPTWRRRLYHAVDVLLPNSHAEAEQLAQQFGVNASCCHVVPNGTSERFSNPPADRFAARVGATGFVLYCGRIEPRKNQLGFLRAVRGERMPVVILGNPVPGHEAYFAACRREAGDNVRFVPGIPHNDPLLASAYAACGCLVLASWFETPGLVALEAATSGVPLVLTELGSAREYFGSHARYVHPQDSAGLRRAIQAALNESRNPTLAAHVRKNFTWTVVAQHMRGIYDRLV